MDSHKSLLSFFLETRRHTEEICKPLQIEDFVVQPAVFVSPPKWHLGHTSWFFEEFILKAYKPKYRVFHADYAYVFNSYYENVGKRVLRTNRGNLSRPSVERIYAYRRYVTKEISEFLDKGLTAEIAEILEIGIHHEKQHQELLLTDIKYILGNNPLFPKYDDGFEENEVEVLAKEWLSVEAGVYEIGHENRQSFCYDNELGTHKVYLHPFQISNKLVTNGEYLEFILAGGYEDFNLWHAEGLDWKELENINQPMYWHKIAGE